MKNRPHSLAALAVGLALGSAAPAHAQYFGKNPVQWERLKFEMLQTEHFDIHYYPEEPGGRRAGGPHGRALVRASVADPGPPASSSASRSSSTPAIPISSRPTPSAAQPGEGTGGVTEAFKRRIVMPVGASLAETDHVLGHELVHAFQYAMTGQGKVSSTNFPGALRMPLWFIEGMAEYLSVGPIDPHTAMWMRDAARKEKLPTVRDLSNARYFPYRYGQALWAYIAGRFGERVFGDALRRIGPRTNDAETVLKEVAGHRRQGALQGMARRHPRRLRAGGGRQEAAPATTARPW